MLDGMVFQEWSGILRTIIVGILAYISLILLLRVSGKRTLSKMNAFDFTVTVALGSTLATVLLNKNVALVEGITAFGLLIFLQFVVTWLSVRSSLIRRLIKADPVMVYYQGEFLPTMKETRIIQEEIYQAIRSQGIASIDEVEAVVLETDGTFSVLQKAGNISAIKNVKNAPTIHHIEDTN